MNKISSNRALARSVNQFPDDATIHLCTMHGPVHYSFCVYCPDFTGKEQLGDRNGRKPSHCNQNGPRAVGEVESEYLKLVNQELIDECLSEIHNLDHVARANVRHPLHETDIKCAYNTDIPSWDWVRHSYYFCFRCGPDETGEIHFRCQSCGDRNVCDNCAKGFHCRREPDASRTARFSCPACGKQNELNLGPRDSVAGKFKDRTPERRVKWVKQNYVPVLYDWIDQRRRAGIDEIPDRSANSKKKPSPNATEFAVSDGWLAGKYWIDDESRHAWLENDYATWKDHLFSRVPHGLNLEDFDYDVVLSYRTSDLNIALDVRDKLASDGISVFLMEAGRNIWDKVWPWRFSQAACRAKHFAILGTDAFFSGDATRAELDEFRTQLKSRRLLHPSYMGKINIVKTGEFVNFLFPSTNEFHKCTVSEFQAVLRSDSVKATSLFSRNVITISPLTYDPCAPCCPNCNSELFFSPPRIYWPNESRPTVVKKGTRIALTCANNHRFCGNCDAMNFENGTRHCCPICFEESLGIHANVAGRRAELAIYYSGVDARPIYKNIDPTTPCCLNCNLEFGANEVGLACRFGHRFCKHCQHDGDGACLVCAAEVSGRISIGLPLGNAAYFHGCDDSRPLHPVLDIDEKCRWCGNPSDNGHYVRFDSMGLACLECIGSASRRIEPAPKPKVENPFVLFKNNAAFGSNFDLKIDTCGCCQENGLEVVTGKHLGYAIESAWAICIECINKAVIEFVHFDDENGC